MFNNLKEEKEMRQIISTKNREIYYRPQKY